MSVAVAYPPPPRPRRVRVAVHAHSVPATESAYDDRRRRLPSRGLTPYPGDRSAAALRLVTGGETASGNERPSPAPPLEAAQPRASMLARALLEVVGGVRPMAQLAPWLSPTVLSIVQSMTASRAARPGATALRRVLVSEPMPGIAEITAIVQRGPRAEALALRMEGRGGRWVVTALQRA